MKTDFKNLKKITISVLMACLLIFSLAACQSSSEYEPDNISIMIAPAEDDEQDDPADSDETEALEAESEPSGEDEEAAAAAGSSSGPVYFSEAGALKVKDGQLTDSAGNAIQLRGISTHGLSWYPEYVNADCFSEISSWGANVIRLAMYTAESGGYCTDGSKDQLKDLIKDGVEYAAEADMYVIIDWHILSDGNPLTYQEEAVSFFDEMSREFADYENILYEICNEPNGDVSWSDIKSYAEAIIPVIRANDSDAVIIVGTPNWSQDIDKAADDPITGYDNIIYSLHFYAATHKDDLRDKMISASKKGLPIFVTEFGICDASGSGGIDKDSAEKWISAMDEYGISYVAWNLSNKDETTAIIDSSVSKTSGFSYSDLSVFGQWLYDLLSGDHASASSSSASQSSSDSSDTAASSEDSSSVLTSGDFSINVQSAGEWQSGSEYFYQYDVSLTNNSSKSVSSWEVTINFNESFTFSDGWCGIFTPASTSLTIKSEDYNGALSAGESVSGIGFIVSGSSKLSIK